MSSKDWLADLSRTALWRSEASRTPIEHLVEYLLTGVLATNAPAEISVLANQVRDFDIKATRVVILGGGTGLSTVVGGNSQSPDWPEHSRVGLKHEFPNLDFVVCTTDDGGSTGKLLRSLPMIGVGDLRKLLVSSILHENLQKKYGLSEQQTGSVVRIIHTLFNHRFPEERPGFEFLDNPLRVVPSDLRPACPKSLAEALKALAAYISPKGPGPTIAPAGHAFGNLFLTAAIFMAAEGRIKCPPSLRELQAGINHVADLVGAPVGRIHAATATPGQLRFRYANGVEVYGQSKSALARRSSPVDRIFVEFTRKPVVSVAIQRAIRNADLIIFAPGSLYTSIIPILQLEPIVEAIRSNDRALKVLGANSWVQEGETDKSLKNQARGFLVSELIEAYDRNIPGGVAGLFAVVLSANLEHIPGNILRNYALEGKSPIHLDRPQVEAMGLQPVEATLFSPEDEKRAQGIHHDARRFALAIRTLLFADRHLKNRKGYRLRRSPAGKRTVSAKPATGSAAADMHRSPLLCNYINSIRSALAEKDFHPQVLREYLLDLAWENRDLKVSHLKFFRGARVIPAAQWNRSTDLDNVLGYYDPADGYLKLHKELLGNPSRLREDLLIALGESLLGRYIESRGWIEQSGARCYEILLRAPEARECFLTDSQLHTYLRLARMIPDPTDERVFRITINSDGGFLPPGLLFGLLFSWYLTGSGLTMEYEMTLLRWPLKSLIPLHAKDRQRKQALVEFFRTDIFGHTTG